jgi:hypothetical protein
MTSRSTNDTPSAEAQAHEAAHGKPAQGRKWKKLTLPDGFFKQDHDACWCGQPWSWRHDDEFHADVWTQVDLTPVEAHEAANGKPRTGFKWKEKKRPEGWEKEEDEDCWCGEPWCDGHEDGDHDDVWQEVRIASALGKRKRKASGEGGSAASPIDCDDEEEEDEAEESEESEESGESGESEEESEEEMPEGYQKGWYGPVRCEE